MLFSDTYKTVESDARGLFKDRGSRFIALVVPVTGQDQIKEKLEELRKEYHDARHHCYAWVLGPDRQSYRSNDDGEPSGTAGRPILGQINSRELTDILIVVIRYFGGTLLGVSGLINAYRSAADDALSNARIIEKTVMQTYLLKFQYPAMNDVMKILKEEGCSQNAHSYGNECSVEISVRSSATERVTERLRKVDGTSVTWLKTV